MHIYFDFPFILTSLVVITGVISLINLFIAKNSSLRKSNVLAVVVEYARSFFPMLLLVLLIRSFLIQPYRVPTGSLEPTIMPVEFIVVNQFSYGLRLPVLNTKILNIGEPKRGDIALFRSPKDPGTLFIKRVIGLPGDRIVYKDKTLFINGDRVWKAPLGMDLDIVEGGFAVPVEVYEEFLGEVKHKIFIRPEHREFGQIDLVVPKGHYFMMGDNRDSSSDSRKWGFVPEENLVGRALGIWMSWDSSKHWIRFERIGKKIN